MNIEYFDVTGVRVITKKSPGSQWVDLVIYDKTGKPVSVITLFAHESKAITLKLGEDE